MNGQNFKFPFRMECPNDEAHDANVDCPMCGNTGFIYLADPEELELVEVTGDVPPVDADFILALTPTLEPDTDWRTRERAAWEADVAAAEAAMDWPFFAEKPIKYEDDGDVLWAV